MLNSLFAGTWIYRSVINTPELVDDFNKVKFGEGQITLVEHEDGLVSGEFDFGDSFRLAVTGFVEGERIQLKSLGIEDTPTAGWVYEHQGQIAPRWSEGDMQIPVIVGSVFRSVAHDGRPAGVVGSFNAVLKKPATGKNVDPLPESVVAMLANVLMRLHHSVWHMTRNTWGALNGATRNEIKRFGWEPPRPSLDYSKSGERKRAITWAGAGEDFLFMHRQMIAEFRKAISAAGVSWQPWVSIPTPRAPNCPTIPATWDDGDLADSHRFAALKTDEFYWSRMRWWDERFKDPVYLRNLSLGELGAEMEWSVHNDMHMRWSGIPRDPVTNQPVRNSDGSTGRKEEDFDPKWDRPNNDDLADFYASHVNPIFYKLHGWIDDRIDDWFDAHDSVDRGSVEKIDVDEIPWFKKGKWVQVNKPWVGPHHGHPHGHEHQNQEQAEIMRKVIRLIVHPIREHEARLMSLGVRSRHRNLSRVSSW